MKQIIINIATEENASLTITGNLACRQNTEVNTQEQNSNTLEAIPGHAGKQDQINTLNKAAYYIAITALWNHKKLSKAEQELIQQRLRSIIVNHDDPYKSYTELVHRILLARRYVLSEPWRYIPSPAVWLDFSNPSGYVGTETWYKSLQLKRQSEPLHNLSMRAYAEAIEEMVTDGSAGNFHYWRGWFIEHESQEMLNLYLSTVGNITSKSSR